jgi:hypothetical protein
MTDAIVTITSKFTREIARVAALQERLRLLVEPQHGVVQAAVPDARYFKAQHALEYAHEAAAGGNILLIARALRILEDVKD